VATNGVALVCGGQRDVQRVTFNGVLDVGNTYDAAVLTVTNGLTLNGTVELGNPPTIAWHSRFCGQSNSWGNGMVVLGRGNGGGNMNQVLVALAGTMLTNGRGLRSGPERRHRVRIRL